MQTADDLYQTIRQHTWRLYDHMPSLISTNRIGQYDGAWERDRGDTPPTEVPMHSNAGDNAGNKALLARLVLRYARLEDANPYLITRHPKFPNCVDLYIR